MATKREQDLVDIMFEVALRVRFADTGLGASPSREDLTAWVAARLAGAGFPTRPCGMCWGVLTDDAGAAPASLRGVRLQIVPANRPE